MIKTLLLMFKMLTVSALRFIGLTEIASRLDDYWARG
jgi:hypothetical protein